MENLTIYNLPPAPPRWDSIGIFFVSYCAVWTFLVACGMVFCIVNRNHPILRLRPLCLSFAAIVLLHSYWIMAQIVYPIGGTMPVVIAYDVQYFVMGTYFPLGIALFHASNTKFLHVARLQRQFAHPALKSREQNAHVGSHKSWLRRIRNTPTLTKIMIAIGVGMVAQVLLTLGMWLACRKYHPTFGIPGTEIRGDTLSEQVIDLGRGWEWWPSVFWQVIWTWIFAPILLWRAWGIRDTLGWRTQTIGCCIFSLHATPMFLIASYEPAFTTVNLYFPPSQWLHLSTMFFEIFAVFLPAFQVARALSTRKKVPSPNAEWETSSDTTTRIGSADGSSLEKAEDFYSGDRLLSMGALEHVLDDNPGPLQEFSALSDFSGENIAFLTSSAAWKSNFRTDDDVRQSFNEALRIYANFVSPRDAHFPLNLPSHDLETLEHIFEKPTRLLYGEARVNTATPFDMEQSVGMREDLNVNYYGEIPPEFGANIFDASRNHVKYLVLTNTWPKFIAYKQRRQSSESGRTQSTGASKTTLVSQISSTLSSMLSLKFR